MPPTSPVFLDTSILIARMVHSQEMKRRIRERLNHHDEIVTGLVVRQEIKRRLLKDAQYLLALLEKRGTVSAVRRHLTEVLPPQQLRKRNICEQLLLTVDEADDEEDIADRLRLFLKSLLRDGLDDIDGMVTRLVAETGCACAKLPIKPRQGGQPGDYDFGTDRCSKIKKGDCGIVAFLRQRREAVQDILTYLRGTPEREKSAELKGAEEFLQTFLNQEDNAINGDPCLKVGDLLIALESVGISHFYTLNAAESRHLCRALNQTLILRRRNPEHEDEIFPPPAEQGGSV